MAKSATNVEPATVPAPSAVDTAGTPADANAASLNEAAVAQPAKRQPKRNPNVKIATVRTDLVMPEVVDGRREGNRSRYPFGDLEIGQSFGIVGLNKIGMQSNIVNATKRFAVPKKDEAGNIIYKMTEAKGADGNPVKDANGNVVKVPTSNPEMVNTREFFAVDVDPAKDPDGATVRVWRRK